MLKGIHLTLLMGPGVAVPVPKMVVDALTNVQVTVGKEQSGFQLQFTVGKESPLLTTLLQSAFFDPIVTRVVIVVTLRGIPHVLFDGVITNHELSPSNGAGASSLTVTGDDLSAVMDIVEYTMPYPAMPDVARINTILAKYAALGIIPAVIPPLLTVLNIPTERTESQTHSTDKAYIRQLAQRNGYVFYIRPGPLPGQSVAYFGPDISVPKPQSALSVNFDAASNTESLTFSMNGTAKKIKVFTIMDEATRKIPIPVPLPNINPLRPPMGLKPPPIGKVEMADDSAQLTTAEAARNIIAFLTRGSSASITVNGSLDVLRYGKLLESRMIVGVRGAGITYDGIYYVDTVTHTIEPGAYQQSFTLSRDGTISNTPSVKV